MKILCLLGFVTQQRGMIQNSFFVVPEWGRRPITKSVEFFFCIIHGVKIWGFKILALKILNSVKHYRILDQLSEMIRHPEAGHPANISFKFTA